MLTHYALRIKRSHPLLSSFSSFSHSFRRSLLIYIPFLFIRGISAVICLNNPKRISSCQKHSSVLIAILPNTYSTGIMHSNILTLLTFAVTALARTDLSGCTSSETVAYGGASMIYYVPGTGEICAFLDCGGGTAPPKTTVPGCPLYSGTASYEPSYLSGYGPNAAVSTMTSSVATATTMAITSAATVSSSALPGITIIESSGASAVSSAVSFATITTAPGHSTVVVGTGGVSATGSGVGNNLTATATLPSTTSHFTGAATALAAGKEMFGLAVGVVAAGLAVL